MELVAVMVGAEQDPSVRGRDADTADSLVCERRQLVGPAAFDRYAPEVELAGHVAREQEPGPIGREREYRGEATDREELLEERQLACFRDCHGEDTIVLRHGDVS